MTRIALLVLLLALAGCRTDTGTGLSDERFIAVIVELRRAAQETRGDPAAYPALREAVLRDADVTEEELRQYVETHGRDVDRMAEVWDSINTRLSAPRVEEQ